MPTSSIAQASSLRLTLSALALGVCCFMATALPFNNTVFLMYSLGYTHYLLAIHYSKRGIQKAWSKGPAKTILLMLLPLSFIPLFLNNVAIPGLVLYFGVHHAMSEVYFDSRHHSKRLRNVHFMAVIGSYFAITGHHLMPWVDDAGWLLTSVMTPAFFIINRKYDQHNLRSLIFTCPWIVLGPLVAGFGELVFLDWRFLINWHFLFWLSLPYLRKGMFTPRQNKVYWIQNIGLSALFFGLFYVASSTPLFGFSGGLITSLWLSQFFLFWSYFHISWSFLISGGNPQWLKRLLQIN